MEVCRTVHLVSSCSSNYPALKEMESFFDSTYCTCFKVREDSLTHTMAATNAVKSEVSKR